MLIKKFVRLMQILHGKTDVKYLAMSFFNMYVTYYVVCTLLAYKDLYALTSLCSNTVYMLICGFV